MSAKKIETIARALVMASLFGNARAVRECGITEAALVGWQKSQLEEPDPAVSERMLHWQSTLTDMGEVATRATVTLLLLVDSLKDLSRSPIDEDDVEKIEVLSRAAERLFKVASCSRDQADTAPAKNALVQRIRAAS